MSSLGTEVFFLLLQVYFAYFRFSALWASKYLKVLFGLGDNQQQDGHVCSSLLLRFYESEL